MSECCVEGCQNDAPMLCESCGVRWCRQCAETVSSRGKTGHFCRVCGRGCTEDTTHKDEIERIRKLIADRGGEAYLTDQGRRKQGSAGIPDIVAFVPVCGDLRLVWIDAKVGADTIRPDQRRFFGQCESAGVLWVAGNVDDVRQLLEGEHE